MTETPSSVRRPPIWLWVVIGVVVVAIIAVVVIFATRGPSPSTDAASASRTPSASSSATPSATPTALPTPTASALPPAAFDSSMDEYIGDMLNTQNTAVMSEGGTFSNPVHVVAAASDLVGDFTPDQAVDDMDFMFNPSGTHTWDLALPASTLATYRAGAYGYFFPVGAIVARSDDGHVFSFVGHGRTVTAMYMAASEELLTGH